MIRIALLGCIGLTLIACEKQDGTVTSAEAVEIANDHMAEVLPQVADALPRLDIETQEIGEVWRVTYTPSEGGTGGPLIVEVEKNSGAVVTGLRGPNYNG